MLRAFHESVRFVAPLVDAISVISRSACGLTVPTVVSGAGFGPSLVKPAVTLLPRLSISLRLPPVSDAEIVGAWPTEGYDHMESKSVEGDKFVGAPQPSLHGPQAPAGSLARRTAYSCCAIARAQAWRATRTTSRTCPRSA